jgi:FkbM family methyltransferase
MVACHYKSSQKRIHYLKAMEMLNRLKGFMLGRIAVLSAVWNHPLNRGSRTKAVRDYFVWNAARFWMDAKHLVTLTDTIDIILGEKENYGSAVYAHRVSDFAEMFFLAHLLRPGDLFLDVGANAGLYSVWVSGVTGASVIAFEPVPATFNLLTKNIRLNDLTDLITAHQTALGSESSYATMTASNGGLDHIVTNGSSGSTVRVEVERLDNVMTGLHTTAIKIDVEGFELAVLTGAKKILADRFLSAIVIELQDWTLQRFATSEREIRDLLSSYDFMPFTYNPKTRDLSPALNKQSLNEIFVRPSEGVNARLKNANRVRTPLITEGL